MESVTNDSTLDLMAENGRLLAEVERLTVERDESHRIVGEFVCKQTAEISGQLALDYLKGEIGLLSYVVDLHMAECRKLQSSLTLSREEGRREGIERAAAIAETVYADQELAIRGTGFDIAAAIRSEAKRERKQD